MPQNNDIAHGEFAPVFILTPFFGIVAKILTETQFQSMPEEDELLEAPFIEEATADHHSAFSVPPLTSQLSTITGEEEKLAHLNIKVCHCCRNRQNHYFPLYFVCY